MPKADSDWEEKLRTSPVPGKPNIDVLQATIQNRLANETGTRRTKKRWTGGVAAASGLIIAVGLIGGVMYRGGWDGNDGAGRSGTQLGSNTNTNTTSVTPPAAESLGWKLAVFDDAQSSNEFAHTLYEVVSNGDSKVSQQRVATNATWARFSPTGEWLAVNILDDGTSNGTTSLWMMKSDGSMKIQVPNTHDVFGAWVPHSNQFVYGVPDSSALEVVEPGGHPQPFPVSLPEGAQIVSIQFSPNGAFAAICATLQTPSGPQDEVIVLTMQSGHQQTLLQTKAPDGIVLGPWAADSQSLFWWANPLHSASLAADGLTLNRTTLEGNTKAIETTLVETQYQTVRTVVPHGEGDALLLYGSGRELFMNKNVGLFQNAEAKTLMVPTSQSGRVQLSPDINQAGQLVAYTEAPSLEGKQVTSQDAVNAWAKQSTLMLYNVPEHVIQQITSVGQGIQSPVFTRDGKHILYLKGSSIGEVAATENPTPETLATLPKGSLQLEDVHLG